MLSAGLLAFATVATVVFAVGLLFVLRTDTVVSFQELYVTELNIEPPGDAVDGHSWRRQTLRRGGVVMAVLGGLGVVGVVYLMYLA